MPLNFIIWLVAISHHRKILLQMPVRVISKRYPAVGKCIYCGGGGRERGLGEEHIIPLSLGGNAILPSAIRIEISYNPRTFTRLLAKIAHCVAILRYGVNGFEPFLLKHILEDDPYAPHLIGGDTFSTRPDPKCEHELEMYTIPDDNQKRIIICKIRLFAYEKMPTYVVATGVATSKPRNVSIMA